MHTHWSTDSTTILVWNLKLGVEAPTSPLRTPYPILNVLHLRAGHEAASTSTCPALKVHIITHKQLGEESCQHAGKIELERHLTKEY